VFGQAVKFGHRANSVVRNPGPYFDLNLARQTLLPKIDTHELSSSRRFHENASSTISIYRNTTKNNFKWRMRIDLREGMNLP
jgi:hypothetical protein